MRHTQRMRMPVRKRNKRLRTLMFVLLLLLFLGGGWVGYVQWTIADVQKRVFTGQADVAIILGAALWNDVPSPALKERLEEAIRLYENKQVGQIIVSGGLDQNGATLTEAQGMAQYLIGRGIPAQAIREENEATNTYENIRFSQRLMNENGWSHAVIVTHRYHGARALDMARHAGLSEAEVSLTDSNVISLPWHRARETLAYTKWQLQKWLG